MSLFGRLLQGRRPKRLDPKAQGATRENPLTLAELLVTTQRSGGPRSGDLNAYPFYRDTVALATNPRRAPHISRVPSGSSGIILYPSGRREMEMSGTDTDTDFTLGHEAAHTAQSDGVAPGLFRSLERTYPQFARQAKPSTDGPDRNPGEYAASTFSHAMLLHRNHPGLSESEVRRLDALRPGILAAWRHVGQQAPFNGKR